MVWEWDTTEDKWYGNEDSMGGLWYGNGDTIGGM